MLTHEDIRHRFRRQGLRMTPQRAAIYAALVGMTSHPTADELLASVRRTVPRISANTVYYTLAAFRRAGLVEEVNYGHDRARFDGNLAPHHHVICRGCRQIHDIVDRRLDDLALTGAIPHGFELTGHRVEVYGYCAACRGRRASRGYGRGRPRSSVRLTRR